MFNLYFFYRRTNIFAGAMNDLNAVCLAHLNSMARETFRLRFVVYTDIFEKHIRFF